MLNLSNPLNNWPQNNKIFKLIKNYAFTVSNDLSVIDFKQVDEEFVYIDNLQL